MPINSSHEADVRLIGDQQPLTAQDVRDLMPWMRTLSEGAVRRLNAELVLHESSRPVQQRTSTSAVLD